MLASGSEESGEARAGAIRIVAFSTTRAITSGLTAVSIEGISSRGALLKIAGRTSVSLVADATNMLHGIPGGAVSAVSTACQVLLRPAGSAVIAVVRADSALARDTFIAGKALAFASVAIANSLVGALSPRVEVVSIDDITNPGKVLRASAQRAVGAGPFGFAINTGVAFAVVVELTSSVAGALVLAHSGATVASLVPRLLAPRSPRLVLERRLAGRQAGGLFSRKGRCLRGLSGWLSAGLLSRLRGWLPGWLSGGLASGLTSGGTMGTNEQHAEEYCFEHLNQNMKT